jgi:hypothetical protein
VLKVKLEPDLIVNERVDSDAVEARSPSVEEVSSADSVEMY